MSYALLCLVPKYFILAVQAPGLGITRCVRTLKSLQFLNTCLIHQESGLKNYSKFGICISPDSSNIGPNDSKSKACNSKSVRNSANMP